MIHKLFQCNRVVSRVTRKSLNFFLGFPYDRVLQVCFTICIGKTDIIVDKVEKIVYPLVVFQWISIEIWNCYRKKFNGTLVCGLYIEIVFFLFVFQFVAETGGLRDRAKLETDSSFPKRLVG